MAQHQLTIWKPIKTSDLVPDQIVKLLLKDAHVNYAEKWWPAPLL